MEILNLHSKVGSSSNHLQSSLQSHVKPQLKPSYSYCQEGGSGKVIQGASSSKAGKKSKGIGQKFFQQRLFEVLNCEPSLQISNRDYKENIESTKKRKGLC